MSDLPSTIRVLVAEDNALERSTLVDLLGALGHMVVAEVESGTDAIEKAQQFTPDAVLLDMHMPGASGVQAAEEIASALPGTAVVLITGDLSLTLSTADVLRSTAVALLPKPTPPTTLDATLRMAVTRARELLSARREAAEAKAQLEARKLIERAKGILMRRTGSSEQEAYRIMQRSSQDRSVRMVDIARAVIESEPGMKP
ncbi:MAG: ANTAR domain-containing protein [Gemmatimonadota bacterium]|jgi:AmiR/NasT family two-component response regulator|nr:ANTAR domain-containing protein [Gemmatimonadota bacterium]MDQ8162572.1 ANTAR domain-containing protein [Gemmatimonadota bacterium]MDQ8168730.1 ANTAR domain-containing protein [Gemmatimonadota bacterium]MDQ8173520.1 ANTAR domain-containing protein [Gemmatimonadota bacterium]